MATIKRINNDYVIQTTNSGSNVTIQSDDIYLIGNLTVTGKQQSIIGTDVLISDNIVVLNALWPANATPVLNAGITINRGNSANVEIIWNETTEKWTLTNDGSTYYPITTGGLNAIIEDLTPGLGGNLNLNQHTVLSSDGYLKFEGNIQLHNTSLTPSVISNSTVLYANIPGSAGSGLYIQNSISANQELVTKSRAIMFSLIL